MDPIAELAQRLDREAVERAKRMPPERKLALGAELFDYACEITKAGIRMEHPEADEATVRAILRQRIADARRRGTI